MAAASVNVQKAVSNTLGSKLLSVEFEIHGKVQGVFFRKYTQKNAKKHGLVGWVMNTKHDTVMGIIQGRDDQVMAMKTWLKKKGSPQSRIERAVFSSERTINKTDYEDFVVKR